MFSLLTFLVVKNNSFRKIEETHYKPKDHTLHKTVLKRVIFLNGSSEKSIIFLIAKLVRPLYRINNHNFLIQQFILYKINFRNPYKASANSDSPDQQVQRSQGLTATSC